MPIDEDMLVETNQGVQLLSKCRPSVCIPLDGSPMSIHYAGKAYTVDEWHEVRDSLGFPLQEGWHVTVVGRPYGDTEDYKISGCAKVGTELKIIKLLPEGAELSDGYHYPRSSYR